MLRIPGARRLSRLWLHLSFPAKGGVIVAIPASCALAMLFLLADAQRRFESSNQWVIHSEQALSQSRELLAASLSAEASARGYLLTYDQAFLDIHQNGRREGLERVQPGLQLTEDNPSQQAHLRRAMGVMQEEIAALTGR